MLYFSISLVFRGKRLSTTSCRETIKYAEIYVDISFILSIHFQGILENAIKITNEPPTGMHANLHAALDNFDQVRKQDRYHLVKGVYDKVQSLLLSVSQKAASLVTVSLKNTLNPSALSTSYLSSLIMLTLPWTGELKSSTALPVER